MKIAEKNYINKQFDSEYGPYIILKNTGKERNGSQLVEIEFLISGARTITRLSRAINNNVRDPQYGVNFNKIYYSDNYGAYKILEVYKGKAGVGTKAKIKFMQTGFENIVQLFHAKNGDIRDNIANHKTPIDTSILDEYDRNLRINRFTYSVWREMIRRCNDNKFEQYKYYGGAGISVCNQWMDFNNFSYTINYVQQYEKWYRFPTLYQLDKDYLQLQLPKNKRIYSPSTCIFLHYYDNINIRNIEYRNNHNINSGSKYFGVIKESNNTYSAQMSINNVPLYLGTFDDEIVAANVYNYFQDYYYNYDIIPLKNDVPYIPQEEFKKHNTNPKRVCNVVDKERKTDL